MKLQRLPPVPIDGPSRVPLLGPAGSLLRFFRDPIRCMRTIHERYGLIAAVSKGDASLVCAFGPDCNRQVLSSPDLFHNAADLPIHMPEGSALKRLSTFLVGMNGEQHRTLRKTMLPLFQKSTLEGYRADMVAAAEGVLSTFRLGDTVDVAEAMAELSLRVSFQTLFGLDVSGEARALADMGKRYTEGATSPILLLLPYEFPGSPYRAYLRLCDGIETRLRALIEERRAREGGRDALSALIAARGDDGAPLPDSLLVGLANELFIAGHETTAATLAWTLFLLDRHPQIANDLLDELTSVLNAEAPTVAQLDQLPLLDAVVKESMRLLPAAAFLFFRRMTEGARIGSHDLPSGTSLIISPLITHHLPDLFPEPRRFLPRRWETAQPGPYDYLPFGAGPRICLGAAFASVSVRVLLALVLQRFRLSLVPNAPISFQVRGVILGTKDGVPMRVEPSKKRSLAPQPMRGDIRELIDVP